MLVLSRKQDEKVSIKIGDQTVIVSIASVNGGHVKLGFDADKEVQILRCELDKRKST